MSNAGEIFVRRFRIQDGISVMPIPKCGFTSIVDSTPNGEDSLDPVGPIYVFIRHPIDRLKSAYRFFRKHDGCIFDVTSWPKFVDYALQNENAHWMLQSSVIDDNYMVFRLSDISQHWPFSTPIKWENRSDPAETPDYRLNDLDKHYVEDLRLWRSV